MPCEIADRAVVRSGTVWTTLVDTMKPADSESPPTSAEIAPDAEAVASQPSFWDWRSFAPVDLACLLAVLATLGFAYAPNLVNLYRTWVREPDYSHGFLVIPIALVILGRLWPTDPARGPRVWLPGLSLVVLGLALQIWFHANGQYWSETATLFLVLFGLGLSRLGLATTRAVWPAFAFLIFLFPLPNALNSTLSQPLQSIATKASTKVLQFSGLWVMPEGNVIMVGNERLEVAAACNGLSMLMSLAAAVVATASIVPMTLGKRLILLATIIPIALVSNILRIAATAWCYYHFGAEVGSKYAHDAAGWLMMPTAMALVGMELWVMSWVVVETRVKAPTSFGPTFGGVRA